LSVSLLDHFEWSFSQVVSQFVGPFQVVVQSGGQSVGW